MKIGNHLELRLTYLNFRIGLSWYVVSTLSIALYYIIMLIVGIPLDFKFFCAVLLDGYLILSATLVSLYIINPDKLFTRLVIFYVCDISISIVYCFIMQYWMDIPVLHSSFYQEYGTVYNSIFTSIWGSSLIVLVVFYWEYSAHKLVKLREQQIRRLDSDRKVIEAQLQVLQAQIEPHFLFNTLANILSLFDTDLEKGMAMQADLIHYLKSSLTKLRADSSTLGLEIEMTRSYLNIFKVRMGERLTYQIDIPESLHNLSYPPMLIQPLVENAIKHGLEPKVEGGHISITTEIKGPVIHLIVADTGLGFHKNSDPSVGLTNTRQRIDLLYGNAGRLILKENQPTGIKAIIEIPYLNPEEIEAQQPS